MYLTYNRGKDDSKGSAVSSPVLFKRLPSVVVSVSDSNNMAAIESFDRKKYSSGEFCTRFVDVFDACGDATLV